MKKLIIILPIIVFIGGLIVFQNNSDISNTPQKWEPKMDEQADVTVTVTPTNLLFDSKEWTFDVILNTHSVELDQNMVKVGVLVDYNGKEYSSVRWEGAGPGGHHREGTLIFDPIKPYPQNLNLIIKNIGGVERPFAWTLR